MTALISGGGANVGGDMGNINDILNQERDNRPELVYKLPDDYDPRKEVEDILAKKGIFLEEGISELSGLNKHDINKLPKYASADTGVVTDAGGEEPAYVPLTEDELGGRVEFDKDGQPIFHLNLKVYLGESAEYWPDINADNKKVFKNILKTLLKDNGKYVTIIRHGKQRKKRTLKEIRPLCQKLVLFLSNLETKYYSAEDYFKMINASLNILQRKGVKVNEDIKHTFAGFKVFAEIVDEKRELDNQIAMEMMDRKVSRGEISERYKDFYNKQKAKIEELDAKIKKQNKTLAEQDKTLAEQDKTIDQLDKTLKMLTSLNESLEKMTKL